jgi:hypothetical protein
MIEASAQIDAATAVIRAVGVRDGEARVLYEGSSVIVGFGPGRPVARVGGLTAAVRDLQANYGREVTLARWLAARGAPIVHAWEPGGPFVRDGLVISLWHEAKTGSPVTASAAGDGLRRCHEALRSFPNPLPPLSSLFDEAERIVDSMSIADADRNTFRDAFLHARQLLGNHGLPEQPLHGDAGLGNVLSGGVWHDWEDSCRGPLIWDLASLVSTARITGVRAERAEATLGAYGDAPGLEQLDAFVALRGLQVLAWSLLMSTTRGHLRASTETRLSWLRARPWSA